MGRPRPTPPNRRPDIGRIRAMHVTRRDFDTAALDVYLRPNFAPDKFQSRIDRLNMRLTAPPIGAAHR